MHTMNNKGSAILLVLVILVSVAVLGVSVMNISSVESKIAGNFKAHEMTFNLTDGTLNASLPLISDSIDKSQVPDSIITSGLMTSEQSLDFFDQLEGFEAYDSATDFDVTYGPDAGDDVAMNANVDVAVDVERLGAKDLEGFGVEFATGGTGFDASSAIVYGIHSNGDGVQASNSTIDAVYYKVLGR